MQQVINSTEWVSCMLKNPNSCHSRPGCLTLDREPIQFHGLRLKNITVTSSLLQHVRSFFQSTCEMFRIKFIKIVSVHYMVSL